MDLANGGIGRKYLEDEECMENGKLFYLPRRESLGTGQFCCSRTSANGKIQKRRVDRFEAAHSIIHCHHICVFFFLRMCPFYFGIEDSYGNGLSCLPCKPAARNCAIPDPRRYQVNCFLTSSPSVCRARSVFQLAWSSLKQVSEQSLGPTNNRSVAPHFTSDAISLVISTTTMILESDDTSLVEMPSNGNMRPAWFSLNYVALVRQLGVLNPAHARMPWDGPITVYEDAEALPYNHAHWWRADVNKVKCLSHPALIVDLSSAAETRSSSDPS